MRMFATALLFRCRAESFPKWEGLLLFLIILGEYMRRLLSRVSEKRYSPPFINFLIEYFKTGRTMFIEIKKTRGANIARAGSG